VIPIPAGLAQVLREWKLVCPKRDGKLDLVFPNGAGNPEKHANVINRGLMPAMLAAGVTTTDGVTLNENGGPKLLPKYTGLHSLRHFFASLCINPVNRGGMALSPKEAQERLGHASIQQTYDTYGHMFPRGDSVSEVDAAERALLG
jgi:integrase